MNRFESYSKRLAWLVTFVLTGFVAGCGGGGDGGGTAAKPGPTPVNAAGVVCNPGVSTGCVDLKTAGTYVILAQTGTTNVPTSAVTGNIGTSPAASTATTGFSENLDASSTFATSSQVTGKMFASNYTGGTTSADLTTAVTDSIAAYTDAAGRPAGTGTNLNHGAGTIGSETLAAGTYTWNVGNVNIATDLTLNGSATDVWIFQISGTLTEANATKVILTGGALAKNVFWQVAGGAAIGTTAHFEGIIITPTAVTLGTGASLTGRIYTGTNTALDSNTVTRPGT